MATAPFTTAQIVAFSTEQIAGLSTDTLQAFSSDQLRALTTFQIPALTTDQVQALTTSQVPVLNTAQIAVIQTEDIAALSTAQVAQLTTAQVRALTTAQVVALETADFDVLGTGQIAALTTAQVAALETADLVVLDTSQIAALTTAQVAKLTTDQVVALTTGQVKGLTTAQIRALTTAQVAALETVDIAYMDSSQTVAFTSSQIRAMSNSQIGAFGDTNTPLVLDLNGDGVRTLRVDDGVGFDIQAVGQPRQTGWAAPTDGLLVRDINRDGAINDGRELFGSGTQLADGVAASDGFQALRALDDNGDGRITAADALFSELAVWTDADRDGRTDAGELRSLTDHGIVALNLSAQTSDVVDNGNLLGLVSSYETADGTTRDLVDVWFRQGAVLGDELRASVSNLTETLGTYVQSQDATDPVISQPQQLLEDAQRSGASGLAPATSMTHPTQGLAAQLDAYYQLQGPTLVPSAGVTGASAADRLLSQNGGAGLAGQSTLLASSDGGKPGK